MKLTIDSIDLSVASVDTYQTFTGDNVWEWLEDSERELLSERGEDASAYDIKVSFDMEAVLKELAAESIRTILAMLPNDEIIKGIDLVQTIAPKEYNYRTDSYIAEWEFDEAALNKWVDDNDDSFEGWCRRSGWQSAIDSVEGTTREEYVYVAKLDMHLRQTIDSDTYIGTMFGAADEIYNDNSTVLAVKR